MRNINTRRKSAEGGREQREVRGPFFHHLNDSRRLRGEVTREGPGGSPRRGYGTMFWRTRERTRQNEGAAESRLLRIEAMMWREGFTQNTAEKGNGVNRQRGNGDTETEGRQQRLNTIAVSASEERNWGKEKEESMQRSVQRKTQIRKGKSDGEPRKLFLTAHMASDHILYDGWSTTLDNPEGAQDTKGRTPKTTANQVERLLPQR